MTKEDLYSVEAIIDKRIEGRKFLYKGYHSNNSKVVWVFDRGMYLGTIVEFKKRKAIDTRL